MMEEPKPFSEEATQVLKSYLNNVRSHLSDTDLNPSEIEESVEELRNHVITHCEIKSGEKVITTDLVREAIKKLGNPKTIAETLKGELDFSEVIKGETAQSPRPGRQSQPSRLNIRAKHITAIYGILSWSITASLIFVASDQQFGNVAWFFPSLYATTMGVLIGARNLDAYRFNKHLRKYVRPNFHTSITPVLFVILELANLIMIPIWTLWAIPSTIVMWLIISSTEYGRQYYINKFNQIKQMIDDINS